MTIDEKEEKILNHFKKKKIYSCCYNVNDDEGRI